MSLSWSLQALLVRHETYVAESEEERATLRTTVASLTDDNERLQSEREALTAHNKSLLCQVDIANNATAQSDIHIASLQTTLLSAETELIKLDDLVRRTAQLEHELEQHELDRAAINSTLALRTQQEQLATERWQTAEKNINTLEQRLRAIEADAKFEKLRQRSSFANFRTPEIDDTEGPVRLAANTAYKRSSCGRPESGTVSTFVKEILQDNATLQLSLVEVQELLVASDGELQRLRQHLSLSHKSSLEDLDNHNQSQSRRDSTLAPNLVKPNAQAVHVHHHYHGPQKRTEPRKGIQLLRRPSKRRTNASSAHLPSISLHHTRQDSVSNDMPIPLSAVSTLVSSPTLQQNRQWSLDSAQPPRSFASSSRTASVASMFDRNTNDSAQFSSRPTTPGLESPILPHNRMSRPPQRISASFFDSLDNDVGICPSSPSLPPLNRLSVPRRRAFPGEADDEDFIVEHSLVDFGKQVASKPLAATKRRSFTDDDLDDLGGHGLRLQSMQRIASQDSLISISGMDVHLSNRQVPSVVQNPSSSRQPSRAVSTQPVLNATMIHAHRATSTTQNSHSLLSGVASDKRQVSSSSATANSGIGKKVGGWMFKWGSSATETQATAETKSKPGQERVRVEQTKSEQPNPSTTCKNATEALKDKTNTAKTLTLKSKAKSTSATGVRAAKSTCQSTVPTSAIDSTTTKSTETLKRKTPMMPLGKNYPSGTRAPATVCSAPILSNFDERALRESLNE